nr:hypothetical protein Iba_chr01aCG16640 [Ipomoea batatas]
MCIVLPFPLSFLTTDGHNNKEGSRRRFLLLQRGRRDKQVGDDGWRQAPHPVLSRLHVPVGVRWFRFSVPAMQRRCWAVPWLEGVPRRRSVPPPQSTALFNTGASHGEASGLLRRRSLPRSTQEACDSGNSGSGGGSSLWRCLIVKMVRGGIGIALLPRPNVAAVLVRVGAPRRTTLAEYRIPFGQRHLPTVVLASAVELHHRPPTSPPQAIAAAVGVGGEISKSATTVGGKLLTLFSLGFTFPWECDGSASLFRQCSGDVGRCRGWKESLDDALFLLLDQRRCSIRVQVTVRPADCFDGVPSPVQRRKHATAATPAVAVAPPSGAA